MGEGFSGGGFSDIFGDLFGDLFGNTGGNVAVVSAVQTSSTIWRFLLKKLHLGIRPKLTFPEWKPVTCGGLGAKSESDIEVCRVCSGTGQQRIQQGFFDVATTCRSCGGQGKTFVILVEPVVEKSAFLRQEPFESTFPQA